MYYCYSCIIFCTYFSFIISFCGGLIFFLKSSSRSSSLEGTLDDIAESYIIEGMKREQHQQQQQQQQQQDLSNSKPCDGSFESQENNSESQNNVEPKLSDTQENISDIR